MPNLKSVLYLYTFSNWKLSSTVNEIIALISVLYWPVKMKISRGKKADISHHYRKSLRMEEIVFIHILCILCRNMAKKKENML